jgi:hydrogenase maturation protease
MEKRALVLTCGNPQRGDDGVAGQVADALRAGFCDAGTKVRSDQQWLPEMAELISEAELVVFVDASAELEPGEVRSEEVKARPTSPQAFTHSMTPAGLLALAKQLYGNAPNSAFLVTIGGDSFELAEELSDVVRHAIPVALDQIKAILSGVSVPPQIGSWE